MPDFSVRGLIWPQSGEPMRVGFTRPNLRLYCSDAAGPIDFSDPGNTVTFTAVNQDGHTVKINAASATGANGYLEYSWVAADTDTAANYRAYFIVVDGAGNTQNYPRGGGIDYRLIAAT